MEPAPSFQVKRKPVGGTYSPDSPQSHPNLNAASPTTADEVPLDAPPRYSEIFPANVAERFKELSVVVEELPPPLPPRRRSPDLDISAPPLPARPSVSPAPTFRSEAAASHIAGPSQNTAPQDPPEDEAQAVVEAKKFWQTALEEARHFAGGLISHPVEATKHYSILRHSGVIVFYRGPDTSVVVTIFSSPDRPLPPSRTLWLQQRGYSGDTGMKLKALVGNTASWIDVTPSLRVQPAELDAAVERGWQRDMTKALKGNETLDGHVARETHIIRIPAAAQDGYYRLVLCAGSTAAPVEDTNGAAKAAKGKTLCPSPAFRIASTSSDSSVFRGAKLRTMPLELGVMVASTFANKAIGTYAGPVAATVQNRVGAVQKRVEKIRPVMVAKQAGQLAMNHGLGGKVTAMEEQYAQTRGAGYNVVSQGSVTRADGSVVIGSDEGPLEPYPLKFQGRVVQGSGRAAERWGTPTANLTDFPEDLRYRLKGVYFGWACIIPGKKVESGVSLDWHEALIIAAPPAIRKPTVTPRTEISVHMVHDFGRATFLDVKMKVIAMGFLRLWQSPEAPNEAVRGMLCHDADTIVASLSREHWGPEMTLDRMKTAKRSQTMADKYANTRDKIQKQVDRIPMHMAGVRTQGAELRDKALGNGGYWVSRSTQDALPWP